MRYGTNRREFLKTAAVAGAGYYLGGTIGCSMAQMAEKQQKLKTIPANEKIDCAFIGCAGKGDSNLNTIAADPGVNVVAMCDVDENYAAENYKKFPDVPKFRDYRVMLDKMAKQIDAVVVSTPDHHHAPASLRAITRGKHVYCEKPLTHTLYEARAMRLAARKNHVATQMGNQGTAENGLREAVEVVQSGAIGDVKEIHVWTNRPVWPQGANAIVEHSGVKLALHGVSPDHKKRSTPSSAFAWDQWLGPAPFRPYNRAYFPFVWRGWWDFGTGALGDMACHTANMAFMACKLGAPTCVSAETAEINPETYPMWCIIDYDFPAREGMPPCKYTWYDGRPQDKPSWVIKKLRDLAHGKELSDSGSILVGTKGTLFSPNDYGAQYFLLPEKDFKGYKPPAPTLPRSPGHHAEFLRAIREGTPAMSNFEYAGPLTEMVLLGNVAARVGKPIQWDAEHLRITNDEGANQFITKEYRKGWELGFEI
jgi:predicted dehydrogenase